MEPTIDPMVLGPLMIVLTTAWFGGMSWAGMHEDETPHGGAAGSRAGDPAPWWTNPGFDDRAPVTAGPTSAADTGSHQRERWAA